MLTTRRIVGGRWTSNLLLGMMVLAAGCVQPGNGDRRVKTNRQETTQRQSDSPADRRSDEPDAKFSGTELWLFGVSESKYAKPFDARGMRMIVDLRTIKAPAAIAVLRDLADRDLGMAICMRWKNPVHAGKAPKGEENTDVPPTAQEATRAIETLRQILTSEPAKKMGKRLYIEIYNEIGGGPGRFAQKDNEAMMAFADRVVPVIRSANPDVRLAGPAMSGGQLALFGNSSKTKTMEVKEAIIMQWIAWTAKNCDVADVHLNGIDVDAAWADRVLSTMRQVLDEHGGQKVELISLEWSCSGYGEPSNEAGTRQYIHNLWDVMNKHHLQVAAYTYWPLFNMPEKMQAKTSWASVIGPDKKPNRVVWDTLVELGKSK